MITTQNMNTGNYGLVDNRQQVKHLSITTRHCERGTSETISHTALYEIASVKNLAMTKPQ